MNPHTYPAARLVAVGRVLNKSERMNGLGLLVDENGETLDPWVLDVRDVDPRISL